MALLAESLVDEWLNRRGFFTVRGIKHGTGEIDLLGVRPDEQALEAWHVEVQASFRPVGYIAPLPDRLVEGFAKTRSSMKARPREVIEAAARGWVAKKFSSTAKVTAREKVWPGLQWKFVMVHAVVREPAELEIIASQRVEVIPLHRILSDLGAELSSGLKGGAGTDLSEIIEYFYKTTVATDSNS